MIDTTGRLSQVKIPKNFGVLKKTIFNWLDCKVTIQRLSRVWKFKASEVDDWIKAVGAAKDPSKKEDH